MNVTVSLASEHEEWIQKCVASGDYASADDYISDLIRRDRKENAPFIGLKAAINDGFSSGNSDRCADDIIRDVKLRLRASAALFSQSKS